MPLTTKGICVQILGSLNTFHTHIDLQTENDCKVALNHLIRAFSEPLRRHKLHTYYQSRLITEGYVGETTSDHVVPVKAIMAHLFKLPRTSIEINSDNINALESWLTNKLIIAEITSDENSLLNEIGLQSSMPIGWGEPNCKYESHPWARYIAAGIDRNFPDQVAKPKSHNE
jgi:hypothetical protein